MQNMVSRAEKKKLAGVHTCNLSSFISAKVSLVRKSQRLCKARCVLQPFCIPSWLQRRDPKARILLAAKKNGSSSRSLLIPKPSARIKHLNVKRKRKKVFMEICDSGSSY